MKPDTREKLRAGYVFILLFVLLTAGIITIGYLSYRSYERQFRGEIERRLSAIAELKVSELVAWRKERLGDAGILFKNASFSALVRNFFGQPADPNARGRLQVWLDKYRTQFEYDRIFLLDAQGVERISAPETPEPVAAHLLEQAPEILRSGRVVFLDFHRDSPDRPIHLSILVPILDGRGDRPALGILVLRIDPGKYLYPYINRWPTPSRSAETLLVRRDGNDAVYLNEPEFQKNTALNLRIPLEKTDVPAVKAALGREGIVEGSDYRGVRVVACLRAVPDSPWFLVARMDTAEAYAPLRERRGLMIALIGALLLGAGAGVGLIWRHQRARFYRERYRTAEARRESGSKLNALFEILPVGVSILDAERKISFMNSALERILEMSREGLLRGDYKSRTFLRPDGTPMPAEEFASARALEEQRAIHNVETGVVKEDGTIIWTSVSAVPVPFPDWKVVIVTSDITGRKRAEDALRESEERFREVVETIREVFWLRDRNTGRILYISPEYETIWGRTVEEMYLKGPSFMEHVHPEDKARVSVSHKALYEENRPFDEEYRVFRPDRSIRWVRARTYPVFDQNGNVTRYVGIAEDITERKRAEEALRRAEENFRRSLDDSPLGVRIVDAEGETLYANRAILEMYGFDSVEELRATPLKDRYTPESLEEFQLRKEKRRQGEDGPFEYQISIVKKNGEIRRLQVFRKEVLWNGQRQFQTLYHDMTEQKRAEEAVQAALREKEVLLREIHHRVKNNMQVISSLFNLQAGRVKDEEARRILKEGQTRIRSMGLIHEKLYQSRDLSKIDFSDYIRSLSVHLFHAYRIDANQVRLETELEDVHLDINAAVPCGLLVNELISNALKHAFPGDRKGVVKIGLRRREDGAVELRVADNGVGFPEKLDFQLSESLGLQIVNLLVSQLEGTIKLERKKGTAIVIAFQESGHEPKTA